MVFVTKLHFKKDGNGGQQRTYFLVKELSKYFDLFIVSPYAANNNLNIDAEFILNKSFNIKKSSRKNKFYGLLFKILNALFFSYKSEKSIHQTNFEAFLLKKQLNNLKTKKRCEDIDIIVFDTVSVIAETKPSLYKNKILNAHNFDSELLQMQLDDDIKKNQTNLNLIKNTKENLKLLKRYEHNIDKYFTELWVCSKADELKFRDYNSNTKVSFYELPNGSDTEARRFQPISNSYKKFLFVGSLDYFPNVNGIKWFVDTIFKHLPPDFILNIVGKSPNEKDFKYLVNYPNINLIGQVESVEPYYKDHDAFIVPLLEGSGTRLKILEALSYGKLVLSTPKGIEGISAKDGIHYLEFVNFDSFNTNVVSKLEDVMQLETIRRNGRQFIETSFSWKIIVENYIKQRYEQ